MKIYKLSSKKDLLKPIFLLKKIAEMNKTEYNIHVEMKICYHIGEDGKTVTSEVIGETLTSDGKLLTSEHHLGLEESQIVRDFLRISEGSSFTSDPIADNKGFANNPVERGRGRKPPPSGETVSSDAEIAKKVSEPSQVQKFKPKVVKMTGF
jgi:hypothetical protein